MINLPYKNIFYLKKIPILCRIYKYCYDNKTLAKPKLFDGLATPLRILIKLIFRHFNQNCILSIHGHKGALSFFVNLKNTQYHAVYFDKFRNGYEPDVLCLIDLLLPADGTFYDIGSNWGLFSIYALCSKNNSRSVFAIDAQNHVLNDLTLFKKINKDMLYRLHIMNVVLSSDDDEFIRFKSQDSFHSGLFRKTNDISSISLKTKKLDSLSISKPSMIKIDVEGMETSVILGGKKIIQESNPYIIVENPQLKRIELIMTLTELDYYMFGIYIISSDGHKCTLNLNKYEVGSIEKNILCVPKVRYTEFIELIRDFSSDSDLIL